MDYFIPKSRWKVLELLTAMHPADAQKFKGMKTPQLFAIYHSIQKKHHNPKEAKPMITPEAQAQIDELTKKLNEANDEIKKLKGQIEQAMQKADEAGEEDLFGGIFDW